MLNAGTKVVFAGSVECFGRPPGIADESTPFDPQSPYAAAKVTGTVVVRSYRESFGLACCTAFLSNHESALRNEDFIFGKVLAGLDRIVAGEADEITTGPLGIRRDFGYAPEFAEGLAAIAAGPCDTDLILATGRTVLLRDAVHALYREFGVDPDRHLVESPPSHANPPDAFLGWDIGRARETIGWRPRLWFPELATRLCADWHACRPTRAPSAPKG
jgi:GDPmannose 4,6-dehydratase